MTHIAFFGHDAGDAAIHRRVAAMQEDGFEVTGFMMRRDDDRQRGWTNIDLGLTYAANFTHRLKAIYEGARIALKHEAILQKADILYARNLDMLICAEIVRRRLRRTAGSTVPKLVYECLDIHHMMTAPGLKARGIRHLETALIKKSDLLVYSSPAFEEHYFRRYSKNQYQPYLLENRLADDNNLPRRVETSKSVAKPLTIGWVGILRCQRSLDLLTDLAGRFGADIQINIHGKPALTAVPHFHDQIEGYDNIKFGGAYRAPADLQAIYHELDLIWAGDWFQAGYNSVWLLPNRLYEGGYFGVPPIAPEGTQTANWIAGHDTGFVLSNAPENSLQVLIAKLLKDPSQISAYREKLVNLPREVFVQPRGEMQNLIAAMEGTI